MPGGGCGHLDPRPAAARELEAVIARRDAPDLIISDHGSGADHLSPRDLAAPAMAIGSNPLRSARKSARTALGSRHRQSLDRTFARTSRSRPHDESDAASSRSLRRVAFSSSSLKSPSLISANSANWLESASTSLRYLDTAV